MRRFITIEIIEGIKHTTYFYEKGKYVFFERYSNKKLQDDGMWVKSYDDMLYLAKKGIKREVIEDENRVNIMLTMLELTL